MGPLSGIRVVELAGLGPIPLAAMLLSDMGAEVIQVQRAAGEADPLRSLMGRGRRRISIDLKQPRGYAVVRRLVVAADVLIEGMRPGVLERLGLAPETLLAENPHLVIGRMTGWGQEGPYARQAGHDINYLGITGGLHAIGSRGATPPPPLNLVADFGGGALYLVAGVLAALIERNTSERGQVIDAAMVDGVSSMLTMFHQMSQHGAWTAVRESNLLDGGAPFYRTYACADDRLVSVGAIEPQFYAELLAGLGFAADTLPAQLDQSEWPEMCRRFAERFATRPRSEWLDIFAGGDACVFPVHTLVEASSDPHLVARGTLAKVENGGLPAPAPRFSRTGESAQAETPGEGDDVAHLLAELGYSADEIAALRSAAIVA